MGRLQNPANAIEDGPALRQEKAASLKGDCGRPDVIIEGRETLPGGRTTK
jgi:hypothetical protein